MRSFAHVPIRLSQSCRGSLSDEWTRLCRCSSRGWKYFGGPCSPRASERFLSATALILVFLGVNVQVSLSIGGQPPIQFDTPYLVDCRIVTEENAPESASGQQLVEARFRVSSILADSRISDRVLFVHRFMSPNGSLQIVDFEPKSEFSTTVVGNIDVDSNRESNKSLGINLTGSFQGLVNGTAGTDLGAKNGMKVHYQLKPPTAAVLAAGTLQRGTGAYFKVRPSAESPLEGSRDFLLRMSVDEQWRGGLMYVRCTAQEERRGKQVHLGTALFVVALYLEGDTEARDAGRNLVLAESRLRRAAAHQISDIEKRSLPTVVHRVGAMLDLYEQRIPNHWLERVIFGPADVDQLVFTQHLPNDVRQLARQYGEVKQRVLGFGI